MPPFESLARVQDKNSAFHTLKAIGVPQPQTFVISSAEDLGHIATYPVFVKRPVSTASSGVRRAMNAKELEDAAFELDLHQSELIAQSQVFGLLAMVQMVADTGRLVAHHTCLRLREGVGGGASLKESVTLPGLAELLARLVAALNWHGALSMGIIVTDRGPVIIDVNPRLVEPANAHAAGVDLVAAMLDVAGDAPAHERPAGGAGERTRQTLLAILGAAEHHGTRGAVIRQAFNAIFARGNFAGSAEELSPIAGDPMAAVPVAAALAATLIHPPLWRKFHSGAVGPYALTPEAWDKILAAAE